MQRDLVEARRWVSKADYLEGLAFAQLSPGPLAAQLAMYIGWLHARFVGATLVAIAFIPPSFLIAVFVAALYIHFGGLPWIQGMFYGIGAAVTAIIARSAIKLVRATVGKDWLLWTVFAVLAITTTVVIALVTLAVLMVTKKIPEPIAIVAAGLVGVLLHGRVG